jgi:hypothetical protein
MSLGSITHLQYYFARTGLLDGKGGQLARSNKKGESGTSKPKLSVTSPTQLGGELSESPIDDAIPSEWGDDEMMLPPTVSTYSVPTYYIPPPPDMESLRNDLQDALDKARQVLSTSEQQLAAHIRATKAANESSLDQTPSSETASSPSNVPPGWYEIEGMNILDVVTLAIRAARIYYTSHERPDRLALIKSDRKLREELFAVLEVLKRWASRNFVGGMRDEERAAVSGWIANVAAVLDEERRLEAVEKHKRASWVWTNGDWEGREREREESFIRCLETTGNPLPSWTPPDETDGTELPTDFLRRLGDGRDLVRFHNEAVSLSRRRFGEIKSYHQDVGKPYRKAENLRYWVKAAEIRWEIPLDVDVMGVVNGHSEAAWRKFDAALMDWCRGVREELTADWREDTKTHSLDGVPPI